MLQFLARKSLHTQLVLAGLACVIMMAAVSVAVVSTDGLFATGGPGDAQMLQLRLVAAVGITGMICLGALYTLISRLLRPLNKLRDAMWHVSEGRFDVPSGVTGPTSRDVFGMRFTFDRMLNQLKAARAEHDQSAAILSARTRTVDRLLEFSQGIQASGKPDQIYSTLTHFLRSDLELFGMALLSVEPDTTPAVTVRGVHPLTLIREDRPVGEMDTAMCPCLRNHLPRHFRADGSPVRCVVDSSLSAGPEHSAYCIPFTVGGKIQAVIHMLLPLGREWDDALKQLAQTYINTAQAALVSLHLLAEAEKTSMTDSLTGLYNRRSLESLMQREVALADRHNQALSLVMIDMDKFKEVNDTHGHAAGDHMLRAFAESVRLTLRRTDLAFRYGGDEFMIALPQTTVDQAQQVVAKLRQSFLAVDFSDAIAGLEHQPTLSIGVASRSKETGIVTLANLLAAADQALYDAKNSDRNCIRVYTPPRAA